MGIGSDYFCKWWSRLQLISPESITSKQGARGFATEEQGKIIRDRGFSFSIFYLSLILIITIPRATAEFDDVRIFKCSTKVFGVLLDNGFASNRFLGGEHCTFRKTYLDTILLCFSHTLADTTMKISDFFLGLLEGGFDLFFGKCHHEVVDEFYITLKERIDCSITGGYINTKKIILGRVED